MAVYAVGDVHGCLEELKRLLDAVEFRSSCDQLWFVGDVINRGPDSLGTIRFIRDLGDRAITLMGNHEARAVVGMSGFGDGSFNDQMGFLLDAPDAAQIYAWLRGLPFLHYDERLETVLVHAGLSPRWSFADAMSRATKLSEILRDDKKIGPFFANFTDIFPEVEPDGADEAARLRYAFAVLTRVRLCREDGQLVWTNTDLATGASDGLVSGSPIRPWYELGKWSGRETVVYGHWAAAGLTVKGRFIGLDSGCVYGGRLTAVRLDHPQRPMVHIPCPCYVQPDKY